MKKFPELYKRTKTGKIQKWSIMAEESPTDSNKAAIVTKQGQLGGKEQVYIEDILEGKNIGKSNETTPYKQACLEAESKWKSKLDEGYKQLETPNNWSLEQKVKFLDTHLPKFNTDANGNIKPMLAQKYDPNKSKIEFPCLGQPKLNGVRCLAFIVEDRDGFFVNKKVKLLSRDGKEYNVSHIQGELINVLHKLGENLILDGELYYHGMPLNKIVSAIKKPNIDTSKIEYHVYDIAIEKYIQGDRINLLIHLPFNKYIKFVNSIIIHNREEISLNHSLLTEQGYEGLMLRCFNGKYGFGQRSKDLLKVKSFIEEEFEIIGFDLGARGTEDMVFHLITKEGKEFKAKPKGTREEKEEYWANRRDLIGKQATVKFFEYTEFGIPFHGHVTVVRDYE